MIATEKQLPPAQANAHGKPQIHAAGSHALLLDAARGEFNQQTQERIWALAKYLNAGKGLRSVCETVPGINNLLIVFDPLEFVPVIAREQLFSLWDSLEVDARSGKEIEIPVIYGGAAGEDLQMLAEGAGITIDEYVRLHSSAVYSVACIGAYAGFGFLTGLPAQLSKPRRQSPRLKVAKGSVIIGGTQAGVMPCAAPSGWHLIGMTELDMFDPHRPAPCLLAAGDRVYFRVKGIEA